MNDGFKPTFIGIGAEKSATTWCWACLNEHPEVCMSYPKELNYFNDNYDRGSEWYAKHFAEPDKLAVGEISPFYMDDNLTPGRIAKDFPDTKILVILRNPYERAKSHLFFDAHFSLSGISEVNVLTASKMAKENDSYIRRSLYCKALKPYFKFFDRTRICILFYDDLKSDPALFISELYSFLGVDASYSPKLLTEVINQTRDYRFFSLFRALRSVSRFAKSMPLTKEIFEWVNRKTTLRKNILDFLQVQMNEALPGFNELFSENDREVIANDISELESLLKIEVPAIWKET